MVLATTHWMPLVNGYSGFHPPSYVQRIFRMQQFPSEATVASLRRDNVRYIIVHEAEHEDPKWDRRQVVERLLLLGVTRSRGIRRRVEQGDFDGAAVTQGIPRIVRVTAAGPLGQIVDILR